MLKIIDGGRTDPPRPRKRPRMRALKVRGLTIGRFDNIRYAVTERDRS